MGSTLSSFEEKGEKATQTAGYFYIDSNLVLKVAQLALNKSLLLSPQQLKSFTELYSLLYRVWTKGHERFPLKGKSGLWKKVTQEWLAKETSCSIKSVERRLAGLKSLGLLRYERQGYIQHKYFQLVQIEDALDLTDKNLSDAEQTNSLLAKRQTVGYTRDKLSVANTRTKQEGIQKVSIEQTFKVPNELIDHEVQIREFIKSRQGKTTTSKWNWQIDQLLEIKTKYGSAIVTDQLKQAIGKGWQSIELTKYEQFNDVIEAGTESVEEEAKRLENMRIHAKTSGATSTWMTSKHSKQYEEILKAMDQ